MDPLLWDSPLQKTSPSLDSVAMQLLSTELTAQAQVLTTHQQQLSHLTHLTEELVKALQVLNISPVQPITITPQSNPPPGIPLTISNPRLAFPDKFNCNPAKCKGFLLQCKLFITQQPHMFISENSKIAFVCSLLTDKALNWAIAIWHNTFSHIHHIWGLSAIILCGVWSSRGWKKRWGGIVDYAARKSTRIRIRIALPQTGCLNQMVGWSIKVSLPQISPTWITNRTAMPWWGEIIRSIYWAFYWVQLNCCRLHCPLVGEFSLCLKQKLKLWSQISRRNWKRGLYALLHHPHLSVSSLWVRRMEDYTPCIN